MKGAPRRRPAGDAAHIRPAHARTAGRAAHARPTVRPPHKAAVHAAAAGHAGHASHASTGSSSLLHQIGSVVSGIVGAGTKLIAGLPAKTADAVVTSFFAAATSWVGNGAVYLLAGLGRAMSASTQPQLGTAYFTHELGVMAVIGAAVALPLLLLTGIQAVVQQDAGLIVRTVLVRVPFALVFTGAAVQLVSLGIAATDAMCGAMLRAARVPAGGLFTGLTRALTGVTAASAVAGQPSIPAFVGFAAGAAIALGALALWLELALRAATIEAATLFLPLALAGVVWPATSHWARRLGETLAALVLSKLVVVAVLALAVGDLVAWTGGGISAVVSGVALLLLAVLAPYALFRLVPFVEAGAVGHLQGLAGHQAMARAGRSAMSLAGLSPQEDGPGAPEAIGTGGLAGTVPSAAARAAEVAQMSPEGQTWAQMHGEDDDGPGVDDDGKPTTWPPRRPPLADPAGGSASSAGSSASSAGSSASSAGSSGSGPSAGGASPADDGETEGAGDDGA